MIRSSLLAVSLLASVLSGTSVTTSVFGNPIAPLAADANVEQELKNIVPQLMEKYKVPGVSIAAVENGKIAWTAVFGEKAAGMGQAVTPDTLFEAASMTKPVVAYVALKLVEEGKLDLDRPLYLYLDKPYMENEPEYEKITARMVMNHTTGFPNWRKNGELKVLSAPGTRYTYSGEGFVYLQEVLTKITGKTLDVLVKERLFDPLGMKNSSLVYRNTFSDFAEGHTKNGELRAKRFLYRKPNAAFTLYCTPSDYAKFLIEIMNPDRSASHSLSKETITEMLKPASPPKDLGPLKRRNTGGTGAARFGLGWTVEPTVSGPRYTHSGSNSGFRCFSEFDPATGYGLVIMTNSESGRALWSELVNIISRP